MKKHLIFLLYLVIIVLVFNYSGITRFIFALDAGYTYSTSDGEYTAYENSHSAPKFEGIQVKFLNYLKTKPNLSDTSLYRTFRINPFKFWQWKAYLTHPRFRQPYISRQEINNNRIDLGLKQLATN